jgi:lipid-A-disaccharide synthase
MNRSIFFIAGEASGDAHAARVIEQLVRLAPELKVRAFGGRRMQQAGAELELDLARMGVVGFFEVLEHLGLFRQALRQFEASVKKSPPQAVVLVDYPGFNFRAAKIAAAQDIPVIYYISPQVWAWKKGRIHQMKKWVQKMLVIFPFEADFYRESGIDVEFVGHPLMDVIEELPPDEDIRKSLSLPPSCPVIGLLPGSRMSEVSRLMPLLVEAARLIAIRMPRARFIVPLAETLSPEALGPLPLKPEIRIIDKPTLAHRKVMDFALTASGTASVENALLGVPMAIVYKTLWPTYLLAKYFVHIEHIGMPNILAGREICKEFIQSQATPWDLANYVFEILLEENRKNEMLAGLEEVRKQLGQPGAAARTAEAIRKVIG